VQHFVAAAAKRSINDNVDIYFIFKVAVSIFYKEYHNIILTFFRLSICCTIDL